MDCPKCGYVMSDLDVDCPRCRRMASQQRPAAPAPPPPPPPPPQAAPAHQAPAPQVPMAPTISADARALIGVQRQGRATVYAILSIVLIALSPIFGLLAIMEANASERLGYPNATARTIGIVMLCLGTFGILAFFIAPAMIVAWTTLGATTSH